MKKLAPDARGIFRIPPFYYLHILDQSSNITKILTGPTTFVRQDNEEVVEGPEKMVTVPPNHYCVIRHPVIRDSAGEVVLESSGQVKLRHGDLEVRLTGEPFPLYPGERLQEIVTKLKAVPRDSALRLQAVMDFKDGEVERLALDQWLFEGPGTYIPRVEVEIIETIVATIIPHTPHTALKIRANQDCKDREGKSRVYGEVWLVSKPGAYLVGAHEEIVGTMTAHQLNNKLALHVVAKQTFTDRFGKKRRAGEEWLVTEKDAESFIPDVYEEVKESVSVTILTNRQFCIILDPIGADGKNQFGSKKLVRGEKEFFLHPGETLESGKVQDICILLEDEAVVLRAILPFTDGDVQRTPGDRWMVKGPQDFCPTVDMEIVSRRKAMPLDENEGVYIRNVKTGKVRAVIGETYINNQDEELYCKELPEQIEKLLAAAQNPLVGREKLRGDESKEVTAKPRDKTRVIAYQVPHNSCVQVFDYKTKVSRVIFGPDLVMLGPDEHFTQLSLSGGQPKRPNVVRTLDLSLGPDFMTDVFTVETSDHARLSLQLCYNWQFEVPASDSPTFKRDSESLFSVPDFVGDACKSIASKIRGAVAAVPFDDFHKHSARIINESILGSNDSLHFPANRLRITNIDIQSVEPVDQRTRDSLMKSVQLAIEITTNSQEATARHEAERLDQEAMGRLERQKLSDEAEEEKARMELLELQAISAAVESTGQAVAEAQSRAESMKIEGEAAVDQAKLAAEAQNINARAELHRITSARKSELEYLQSTNELEISKKQKMADIESTRFKCMVEELGPLNIAAIATSGKDNQVRMLQALGLKSTLITDGSTPLNLFNTAQGLIGGTISTSDVKIGLAE